MSLENSMVMYGVYTTKALGNLLKTVHHMHNTQNLT